MRNALLALLANAPAHGYELKVAIESSFGDALPPLNIGQVYSTLARLERDGLVTSAAVSQEGRPDKRVYEITPTGRDEIRNWIEAPVSGPRLKDEFFQKLVLSCLPEVSRLNGQTGPRGLIARQRREYLRSLRELNLLLLRKREEGANDSPAALFIEGAILHLEADLKWLDLCEQRFT